MQSSSLGNRNQMHIYRMEKRLTSNVTYELSLGIAVDDKLILDLSVREIPQVYWRRFALIHWLFRD